jgi:hypothetical protein
MHWGVLLTENCTQCTFEGARRYRARANAFRFTPLSGGIEHNKRSWNSNWTAIIRIYFNPPFMFK